MTAVPPTLPPLLPAQRRARPYLLLWLAVALVFLLLSWLPALRVGDGAEYYAMFYAWTAGWRPWTTAASQAAYDALLASNKVIDLVPREWFDTVFAALRIGETTDFNHFWFYSLLAALCHQLVALAGVDLSPHASFLLLHAVLVAATFSAGYRYYGWRGVAALGLLLVASPMVWFLNKVHTELFTVCLLALGLMQMQRTRYAAAALWFALVSTQNPSFALIAGLPWAYRVGWQWRQPYRRGELLLLAAAAFTVLLHPAYYQWRYGVVTPQLLAGGADLGGNLSTFYIWIVDPDVGLLPNWPLGTAALLLAGGLWLAGKHRGAAATDRAAAADRLDATARFVLPLFILLYLLINFFAQSSTTNLNSGGTPGLARYALWYLPLGLPLLLWIAARVRWRSTAGYALGLLCAVLTVVSVVCYDPHQPEQYYKPTLLSLALQRTVPGWYDPPPVVFTMRYSGARDSRAFQLVVGPDCRKTLLLGHGYRPGAAAPGHCLFDPARLDAYRRALGDTGTRYVYLTDAQAAQFRLQAPPGNYPVGLGGRGGAALGAGWSQREPWGVWSEGSTAKLHVPCAGQALPMALALKPFSSQRLTIRSGGAVLWQGPLAPDGPPIRVAPRCAQGAATVTIDISNPTRPSDLLHSNDTRSLGIGLSGFELLAPGR